MGCTHGEEKVPILNSILGTNKAYNRGKCSLLMLQIDTIGKFKIEGITSA